MLVGEMYFLPSSLVVLFLVLSVLLDFSQFLLLLLDFISFMVVLIIMFFILLVKCFSKVLVKYDILSNMILKFHPCHAELEIFTMK